jgi:uncharacterized protein
MAQYATCAPGLGFVLLRQSSESLAGRIEFVEMGGFDLTEVGDESWQILWWRGGFPRSYLT